MTNYFYTIGRIALYEAKLLFRSWGFRIFSALALIVITLVTIGIGTTVVPAPYFFFSLSGSLPLNSIKLFNVFQGIIAAFLAAEFFKRDRRHDTNQVVYARSFSNLEYILGKVIGILGVLALLNIVVMLITLVVHLFFSDTVFAWQPYLFYPLLISLPTVVFVVGISILLVTLIRSQAVVFVLMLGYSFLVLVFIGSHQFCLWDSYAFYQPLIYSDFIGWGNLGDFLQVRGVYLLLGIGFIGASVFLIRRLRQSMAPNLGAGIITVVCILGAILLGHGFLKGKYADRQYRHLLKTASHEVHNINTASVTSCDITLRHEGDKITATAKLEMVNNSADPLDSFLLTLNPGLMVKEVSGDQGNLRFHRENHLLRITPDSPLKANETTRFSVSYSGSPDERYCYLDIPDKQIESRYRLWLYDIPKRYAMVNSDYVLLTPGSGWYPISGLPPGAAFPSPFKRDFSKYSLSVTVPEGMKAISQGVPVIETREGQQTYTFKPKTLLPQISLILGRYELRQIKVDDVVYSLYTLPGHDYFVPYFDQLEESFPKLIRDLKAEYEIELGLEYPYGQLSMVEVPIQIFSYQRSWTRAHEMVQPQVVLLPEMGTICSGADFKTYTRLVQTRFGRRNVPQSPQEIQSMNFSRFIRSNLLGTQAGFRGFFRGTTVGQVMQANVETQFELFPNMLSYSTHIESNRWPVLNYALESYLQDQTPSPGFIFRFFGRGLTDAEQTNLLLNKSSLARLVGDDTIDTQTLGSALETKGRYLFALLGTKLQDQDFRAKINGFLANNRFRTIAEQEFIDFIGSSGNIGLPGIIDTWYNETRLPGFLVENIESFQVIGSDSKGTTGEGQVKTQVKFRVTNPTDVGGIVKISFIYRRFGRMGGGGRGPAGEDYSRFMSVPARTVKEVGIVLDEQPFLMSIDTYVSQNIPSVISENFRRLEMNRKESPEEFELSGPYVKQKPGANGEFLVDNEDPGFEILSQAKENWLRRALRSFLGSSEEHSTYKGFNIFSPPGNWTPVVFQEFYGKFVQSGIYKKSGSGSSKVAWNVELEQAGNYDIYFSYEGSMRMMRFMRRGRDRQPGQRDSRERKSGKKHFLVYQEDGIEEVTVDLRDAEAGWNLLGTFRLTAGKNRVELTDKNDIGYVTADAVKWIKK
jgi:ABC-type transport system involved in multi-copper enzyme maturation permease subunit